MFLGKSKPQQSPVPKKISKPEEFSSAWQRHKAGKCFFKTGCFYCDAEKIPTPGIIRYIERVADWAKPRFTFNSRGRLTGKAAALHKSKRKMARISRKGNN